jgi:hypothetical protein
MEEATTPNDPTLVNHSIKWAVISAAIGIVITLVLYVIDYTVMVQIKFALFSLVLYLGIVIYAGIDYRKSVGGFLDYGKAYLHGFLVLAIGGLISTFFQILLYFVIDPDLPAKLVDAAVENTQAIMEQFGAPASSMDEALDKARTDTEARFTILGLVKGYFWAILVFAVLSLITALVVRKRPPVEEL